MAIKPWLIVLYNVRQIGDTTGVIKSRKSINKGLKIQWLEQKELKDKQWATTHYAETRKMSNRN